MCQNRLARQVHQRSHLALQINVLTVAREPQHRGILKSAIDARRHDSYRLTVIVQILGKQQSFQVIPHFVTHDVTGPGAGPTNHA